MTMHKSMFADEAHMRYPIDTPQNTAESLDSFMKEASMREEELNDNLVLKKLVSAADYHGIEVPQYKKAAVEREKVSFKAGEGTITMAKIANVDDLHKAVGFLLAKRSDLRRDALSKAAAYVVQAADALDINIDDGSMPKIARIAGIGVGDREDIENEFDKRATLNILDREGNKEFWDYSNELKAMSDDDFFKSANLERVCSTLEDIDELYKNANRYGKDLKAPEDVVFKHNITDLEKEASDLMLVPSIDVTVSKKELLKRASVVNDFLTQYFGATEDLEGEKLLSKVASMDKLTAEALFERIDD